MNSLAQSFNEGGPLMYPLALVACALAVTALTLTILALASKKNPALPFGVALLIAAIIPPAVGLLAERMSMASVEKAIVQVSASDRAALFAAAKSEAMNTTVLGFGGALCPTVLGFALLGLGLSKLERFKR